MNGNSQNDPQWELKRYITGLYNGLARRFPIAFGIGQKDQKVKVLPNLENPLLDLRKIKQNLDKLDEFIRFSIKTEGKLTGENAKQFWEGCQGKTCALTKSRAFHETRRKEIFTLKKVVPSEKFSEVFGDEINERTRHIGEIKDTKELSQLKKDVRKCIIKYLHKKLLERKAKLNMLPVDRDYLADLPKDENSLQLENVLVQEQFGHIVERLKAMAQKTKKQLGAKLDSMGAHSILASKDDSDEFEYGLGSLGSKSASKAPKLEVIDEAEHTGHKLRRRMNQTTSSAQTIGLVSAGLLLTGFLAHRFWRRWTAKPKPVELYCLTGGELA